MSSPTPNNMPARISEDVLPIDPADYCGNTFDNSVAARLDMTTEDVMVWVRRIRRRVRPDKFAGVKLTEYNRY